MKNVLIVDCETTGTDRSKDQIIELGYILWSVEHRTMLEVFSGLMPCAQNPAEAVNGIPSAALPRDQELASSAWGLFCGALSQADAIVAHQADFDRAFVDPHLDYDRDWICTREDMKWPRATAGQSLIAIALAHGVAIVAAHRAVNDCLTLARLFEAVPDIGERLEAALVHARLPKARLVSLAPYEEREIVKENGFKWDPGRKEWWRFMCVEDAKGLPFRTEQING